MSTSRHHRTRSDRVDSAVESLARARRTSIAWRYYFAAASVVLVSAFWGGYLAATDLQRKIAVETATERTNWRAAATEFYVSRIVSNAEAVDRYVLGEAEADPSRERMAEVLRARAANNDALAEVGLCRSGTPVLSSASRGAMLDDSVCASVLVPEAAPGKLQIGQPIARERGYVPVFVESVRGCGGDRCAAVSLLTAETILRIHGSVPAGESTCIRLEDAHRATLATWDATGEKPLAGIGRGSCRLPAALPKVAAEHPVGRHGMRVVVETGVRQRSRTTDLYLLLCIGATAAVLGSAGLLWWLHRQHAVATRNVLRMRRRLRRAHGRLEAQVAQRTSELERANDDLQAYASRVAHDVKGPLVAIRAFAHALRPTLSRDGSERDMQYLQRIQDGAQQMLDVADRLLLIGRVPGLEAPGDAVDIGQIARDVLEKLAEQAGEDVTYAWHVDKGIVVPGDRTLLRQAVENLVSNAWKFSAQTGHVRIEVRSGPEKPGRRTFFVRDNGIGFDSRSATGLFQPFARFHSSENHPGSGIGLAIVHRIVQLHGGTIRCESEPGRGATFFVDLPMAEGDSSVD